MATFSDTQTLIITKSSTRKDIVPTREVSGSSVDARAYSTAVAGLIKRGMIEQAGAAAEGDFSKDGWRYRLTSECIEQFYGDEEREEEDEESDETFDVGAIEPEDVDGEEESDEKTIRSIVPEVYRRKYTELKAVGGSGQDNNDNFAQWMREKFFKVVISNNKEVVVLDVDALNAFAAENGIDGTRWSHLNNGQKRMNVGNACRTLIKKGFRIICHGKVVFKGKTRD